MNTQRTEFEIRRDIREYQQKLQEATLRRDYARIRLFSERAAEARKELEDFYADKAFWKQEKNLDPNLVHWAAKTLGLMLNMADLAIYYYDLYMLYFRERGFVAVPEWQSKAAALEKATNEFRSFVAHFFQDRNVDYYHAQMGHIADILSEKIYTDRERMYLEQYEQKTR